MTKFEEEFNYLIELSGKVLIGQVDAEAFEKNRIAFFEKYETNQQQALPKTVEDFQGELEDLIDDILDDYISDLPFDGKKYKFIEKYAPQALPVVPECVGNFLSGKSIFKIANGDIPDDVISWVQEQTYYVDLEKIISHLIILKVTGFTVAVEKPQLFYLKHIDMSKSDAHLNWYLAKGSDNVLLHQGIKKNKIPKLKCILKLTQQEIDSMQTGSYEQIEVAE